MSSIIQLPVNQPRFGEPERHEVREHYVRDTLLELRTAYLEDDRPWVVGFSGGKDSTTLMQLVYYMLARLPEGQRHKHVYVLASDTRVEAPYISARIRKELEAIQSAAENDRLPITAHLVFPKLNETFWVNLIGRGYPSPNNTFRWCTDRLKIRPVSDFIRKTIDKNGEVIVVLGARKDESDTRAQTMNASTIAGQRYRPHADLPRAWVYTPIEDFSSNEVWIFILQTPSPWSGDNRGLVSLYKQANKGGECPLVIDSTTPSCGQSRFGCWTCTVIERDHSMESLVDSGEEELLPLLDVRDFLKDLRNKPGARYDHRRNGQAPLNRHTGEVMTNTGPFKHSIRMEILRRVLEAQRSSGFTVIEADELAMIQEIWMHEEQDHPDREAVPEDAVVRIWNTVQKDCSMSAPNDDSNISREDSLLTEVCDEHDVPADMLLRLRELEEEHGHLKRRHGLPEQMREVVRLAARQRGE